MKFRQSEKSFRMAGWGLALTGVLMLGACGGYEQGHPGNPSAQGAKLDGAKTAMNSGTGFTGDLGRDYYAIASQRAADKDWTDSDYFAGKSIAASNGTVVPPEQPVLPSNYEPLPQARAAQEGEMAEHARTWLIPGNASAETGDVRVLNDARQSLVTALDSGGREKFPALAARSQALYDCWIERSEHNVGGFTNAECRRDFVRDYTDLTILLNPPAPRNAYFEYNSAKLTPEGAQQVKQAVARIAAGTAHLKIIGKADRSGSDPYNMKLSEKRAQAIRDAAVAAGLPANRIDVAWTGEQPTHLPVATKDGVKEAKNRVVEIDTVVPSAQVAALPME